jgi:hypothetical protein
VEDAAHVIYSLGHQMIWVGIGIAAGAAALVLSGRGQATEATVAWSVAAGSGTLFLGSLLATRRRLQRRRRR